ncbi:ATP-binding protein [Marinobacterium jannaschii]|uniref:ATP-binding protein n=1 Tax=Marinobacterium jannaschii TaxID=64970 RepID=UPI000488F150|nr:ATP-binding protein [Marinobacterium jannaschii]
MISIKRILTRQFLALSVLLLLLAGLLYGWLMNSTIRAVQKDTLVEESDLIYEMLSLSQDKELAKTLLYHRRVPRHAFMVAHKREIWQSGYSEQLSLPAQQWFTQTENTFEYEVASSKQTFLVSIKRYPASAGFPPIKVAVAKDITASNTTLRNSHIKLGLILSAVLAVMIYLQHTLMRMSFLHFDVTRREVQALHKGESIQLSSPTFTETAPLINAINDLATSMLSRSQRTRNAIGNLSHAMKTPLAVLHQISASKNPALPEEIRSGIARQADQLNRLIEQEMRRAVIAGERHLTSCFSIQTALEEIAATLKMIHRSKTITTQLDIQQEVTFPGEQADFMELAGNLMDNAAKWCEGIIRVSVSATGPQLQIVIEDDGKGCNEEELANISKRGVRLDESIAGAGLGLGIVKDIVNHHNGSMNLMKSELGGLRIDISLPLR